MGAGHAHEPHLSCTTIYLHGSDLDTSGTYDIASIPPSGSGATIVTGSAWAAPTNPATSDVIASFSASAVVDAAIAQDNAVPNPNQGYHFKLLLHQASGDKYKTFWVSPCGGQTPTPTPTPTLTVTKTADASPVVSGGTIGFTITVAPEAGSFANDVSLNDPLPSGDGISWFLNPAVYAGPGTCAITGSPPSQTLSCTFGDLNDTTGSATQTAVVHVQSHTVAGTTAALSVLTLANTVTTTADDVPPASSSAQVLVTPAPPALAIAKTADASTVTAGSQVGFTIAVGNTGGVALGATLRGARRNTERPAAILRRGIVVDQPGLQRAGDLFDHRDGAQPDAELRLR
jgi:uncharacterized repeat protein (TIGR01451 family)